jgi:hypothetical protein
MCDAVVRNPSGDDRWSEASSRERYVAIKHPCIHPSCLYRWYIRSNNILTMEQPDGVRLPINRIKMLICPEVQCFMGGHRG